VETFFMRNKRKAKERNLVTIEEKESKPSFHYLNLPAWFVSWVEKPGNIQKFKIYLGIQSVILTALLSWWQTQIDYQQQQEDIE